MLVTSFVVGGTRWIVAGVLVAVLAVAGCQRPAQPTEEFAFALVLPNPRGDRSFIDASVRGAERAQSELQVKGNIIEARGVSEQEQAIFGIADAVAVRLQTVTTIPPSIVQFLPNIAAIVALVLVGLSGRLKRGTLRMRTPAAAADGGTARSKRPLNYALTPSRVRARQPRRPSTPGHAPVPR